MWTGALAPVSASGNELPGDGLEFPARLARGESWGRVRWLQRTRLLAATVATVDEVGYARTTVAGILDRARISRKTFYDMFENRDDCVLATFDAAIGYTTERVTSAWKQEAEWPSSVHSALFALLEYFDEEPKLARLCVVHALQGSPRVYARRAEVLGELADAVQAAREVASPASVGGGSWRGRSRLRAADTEASARQDSDRLRAECFVGAVFMIVHSRLLEADACALSELAGPLMSVLLQLYREDARHERPPRPQPRVKPSVTSMPEAATEGIFSRQDVRLTNRTLGVLAVLAEGPGASNTEIATRAGVSDQGQMSKLLARLARLGLIRNAVAGQPNGGPNAWGLTSEGAALERAAHRDIEISGLGRRRVRP